MTDEIILTETRPGLWEFVRNGFRRSVPATAADKEAREEAFFATFAPASPRRKYLIERFHWAHLVIGFYAVPIAAILLSQILS